MSGLQGFALGIGVALTIFVGVKFALDRWL